MLRLKLPYEDLQSQLKKPNLKQAWLKGYVKRGSST